MTPSAHASQVTGRPPERAWSPIIVGQLVVVDVVGLRWGGASRPGRETVVGTIAAIGPGFICVRAEPGESAVELTVSSDRLRP
jgi:hypothetical protein